MKGDSEHLSGKAVTVPSKTALGATPWRTLCDRKELG